MWLGLHVGGDLFLRGCVALPFSYCKPPYVISIRFLSDQTVTGFACPKSFFFCLRGYVTLTLSI